MGETIIGSPVFLNNLERNKLERIIKRGREKNKFYILLLMKEVIFTRW